MSSCVVPVLKDTVLVLVFDVRYSTCGLTTNIYFA
jgi:hypothetical protein